MSTVPYRFSTALSEVESLGIQCPPAGATPKNINAWRWVANPMTHQCFDPPAVRNPNRLLKDPYKACSSWALSMYLSQSQSIKAFKALEKNIKKARKIFGDHVASVVITQTDGVCTQPDWSGHFDLHQYSTSAVQASVSVTSSIP